jgi:hypothetical protein
LCTTANLAADWTLRVIRYPIEAARISSVLGQSSGNCGQADHGARGLLGKSLDHLVGAREQRWWNFEAERLSGG